VSPHVFTVLGVLMVGGYVVFMLVMLRR